MSDHFRNVLIEIISALFILLFVYTAADKLVTQVSFQTALNKSPLLGFASGVLTWLIPIIEMAISAMLFVPKLRGIGMAGAFYLMLLFTLYIASMVLFSPNLPCTCGGVISKMSWNQHLIFNLVFTLLAGLGVWLMKPTKFFIAINRVSRKPV